MTANEQELKRFRSVMVGSIDEFIGLQNGSINTRDQLHYLNAEFEIFLRHLAVRQSLPIRYIKSATILISDVLRFIPIILSDEDKNKALEIFIFNDGIPKFNRKSDLFIKMSNLCFKYLNSEEQIMSVSLVRTRTIVKMALINKKLRGTLFTYFGFKPKNVSLEQYRCLVKSDQSLLFNTDWVLSPNFMKLHEKKMKNNKDLIEKLQNIYKNL
ncbi:hypothetical protein WA158_006905 [Blastocystis sp. Blastoise]